MIRVYIWNYQGKREAWGHASMHVGNKYISWWPMATGRNTSKVHSDIFSAHPRFPTLEADIKDEGRHPDHTLNVNGLDESRISNWWARTFPWAEMRQGPPMLAWSSLDWNCSKIVATALKEGGGDNYASLIKSWNVIWTPNDVLLYTKSIISGMA